MLAGKEIGGGKGPFRDVAHQLEEELQKRYVPDLEKNVLTLRRWEKDYLLRRDKKYVNKVQSAIKVIQESISSSHILAENKKMLTGLVARYAKDFLALVEENNRIITLTARMRNAVHKVEPLVAENVQDSIVLMERKTKEIQKASRDSALFALSLSLLAFLTAIFFAVAITRRITVPLYTLMRMAEIHTDDERISENIGQKNEVMTLVSAMGRMDGSLTMTFSRLAKEVESLDRSAVELFRISNEMTSQVGMSTFGDAVKIHTEEVLASVTEVKAILLPRIGAAEKIDYPESSTGGRRKSFNYH